MEVPLLYILYANYQEKCHQEKCLEETHYVISADYLTLYSPGRKHENSMMQADLDIRI